MQVKLVTTIETIIEVDPENTQDFETAKCEIFNNFLENFEEEHVEDVTSAHQSAVIFDKVIAHSVEHAFKKVE